MSEQYFRHVDGGLYRFVAYARSADDAGEVVVYEHLWPFERGLWVRKQAEFEDRFSAVDELTVERAMKEDRTDSQERVNAAKAQRRRARKVG
jgi:hypothetical protein